MVWCTLVRDTSTEAACQIQYSRPEPTCGPDRNRAGTRVETGPTKVTHVWRPPHPSLPGPGGIGRGGEGAGRGHPDGPDKRPGQSHRGPSRGGGEARTRRRRFGRLREARGAGPRASALLCRLGCRAAVPTRMSRCCADSDVALLYRLGCPADSDAAVLARMSLAAAAAALNACCCAL